MGLVNNFKRLTLFTFSAHSVVRCAIYLSTCRLLSKLSLNRNLYLCLCTRLVRFLEVHSDMSHIFSFLLSFKDFPFFWNNGSYYGSYFFNKVSVSVCRILCKEASRKSNVNLFCTIRIFLNVLYPVAVIIY